VRFRFRTFLVPGRKVDSMAEHRELLRAVEAGDAERAERAARVHVKRIWAAIEQYEPLATT
jgi:DNA-binding GntR family transcriptional regulator